MYLLKDIYLRTKILIDRYHHNYSYWNADFLSNIYNYYLSIIKNRQKVMPDYYVNKNTQDNGDHEIHIQAVHIYLKKITGSI